MHARPAGNDCAEDTSFSQNPLLRLLSEPCSPKTQFALARFKSAAARVSAARKSDLSSLFVSAELTVLSQSSVLLRSLHSPKESTGFSDSRFASGHLRTEAEE
eukprot:6180358-Pleurochrysis_carterae.AAC.1